MLPLRVQHEGLHLLGAEVVLQAVHVDGVGGIEGGGELLLHEGDLLLGPALGPSAWSA
jgi:hypothetical protein